MKLRQSLVQADSSAIRSIFSNASLLVTIGVLSAATSGAFARGVTPPSWMQSQLAAALPPHDEETDAVTLYSEIITRVDPNGKIHTISREVYRILRIGGAKRALVRVDFNAQSRVNTMHGWAIPSEGKPYE